MVPVSVDRIKSIIRKWSIKCVLYACRISCKLYSIRPHISMLISLFVRSEAAAVCGVKRSTSVGIHNKDMNGQFYDE